MLRLLLILIALVVLLRLLGWTPPGLRRPAPGAKAGGPEAGTDLVVCERCKVHIPRSAALQNGGRWFCSAEHRDA